MRLMLALAMGFGAALLGASATAQTGPGFCAGLKQAAAEARTGFPDLTGERIGPERPGAFSESHTAKATLDGAASCSVEQMAMAAGPPQRAYHCEWRSGGIAAARKIYAAAESCLGGDARQDAPLPPSGPTGPALLGSIVRPGVVIIFQGLEAGTSVTIVPPTHPFALIRPGRP